jgi:predicted dehydrogenase
MWCFSTVMDRAHVAPHRLLQSGALGIPRVAVCETLWYRPDDYFLPEWRGNWVGEGGGPTLGHGIHQTDLLLHLLGPWETVDGRAVRIARPVEFEDVSLAILTFGSGAVGTVVTSLLSPRELSRIRVDTTGGTPEVNHVYAIAMPTGPGRPCRMRQRLPVLGAIPV